MATTPVIEVFKDAAGNLVIEEADPSLGRGTRRSVSVHPKDVPFLIDALSRAIEGFARDPEDLSTNRSMRPVGDGAEV